ncbi:ABC transporter permease [Lysinibacillus sp. LZ02]|uniref:ABC transporter permease n=1 Tax=Lysinibacillus sp. LZ02 TaxID=3420668 RepID=UPI003D3658EC
MSTFFALSKKEISQMMHEYKIIWLPIVFILLGLTQPILMFYLPVIVEMFGGVEGITIDPAMTNYNGREVLASTLSSQFDQLGIIILVVASMGVIQAERANGMLAFILTRPVSIASYLGSKMITHYVLAISCVAIGYFVSYSYTAFLFTAVPFANVLLALAVYSVWILFLMTFVVMLSAMFNSQAFIALVSIVVLLLCRLTAGLHPLLDIINPGSMSVRAISMLMVGSMGEAWLLNMAVTLLIIIGMVQMMHYWIVNKKY